MARVDPNFGPFQHGEVFVTSDGTETILIWSLWKFNCKNEYKNNFYGKIYDSIIKERLGEYSG